MHQALRDKPLTVFGDGSQTRSFCHVDDLVLLAESGEHAPVNLGSPAQVTLLELAEAVIRVTGSRSEITYEALPAGDPRVRLPDITRARELLGREPEISLEDGLRRLAASASSRAGAARGPVRCSDTPGSRPRRPMRFSRPTDASAAAAAAPAT
jgi:dTDP-glucose 4,6-dehydratase